MKKNQIAIDFINFGEESENTTKLEAFIQNVNSSDNSHLATIPPGPHLLSDQLVTTPILGEDNGMGGMGGSGGESAAGGGGSGGAGFDFGVDPHLDPELALALRMSLEEENSRQERERKEKEDKEKAAANATTLGSVEEKEEDENAPLLGDKGEGSSGAKKEEEDDTMDEA